MVCMQYSGLCTLNQTVYPISPLIICALSLNVYGGLRPKAARKIGVLVRAWHLHEALVPVHRLATIAARSVRVIRLASMSSRSARKHKSRHKKRKAGQRRVACCIVVGPKGQ